MKTKILLGCFAAASILATSCSDFLDEDPKGKLTSENYFSNKEELNMSVYALFQKVNNYQTNSNTMIPQWQGDDITSNPSTKQDYVEVDGFKQVNNSIKVNECWTKNYIIVKAANYIIMNAAKTPTAKEDINIAIGQAKFWRAYAYFNLVRIYGPLPMNLDNVNDDYTKPLTSVEDVYAQIVSDLTSEEVMGLPATYAGSPKPIQINGTDTYITIQAAKSMLAAVYMAMAGYPLNKGTEYYAKAAKEAGEVIAGYESGKYDHKLNAKYMDVYSMGNNYEKETILGLNFSPFDWSNQDSQFTSCCLFASVCKSGWGDLEGEIAFWKRFPDGPRKAATYDPKILNSVAGNGELLNWWDAKVTEQNPMFSVFSVNAAPNDTKPYDYRLNPNERMINDHRHRLIRLSEVMLWYAESLARSNGDLATAKKWLKEVRRRGMIGTTIDGTEYSESGNAKDWDKVTFYDLKTNTVTGSKKIDEMSADEVARAAYDEHGWEVAGYCFAVVTRRADQLRMDDLKNSFAYRAANPEVEVADGVKVKEGVPVTGSWNEDWNYLPYPNIDADLNPNLKR